VRAAGVDEVWNRCDAVEAVCRRSAGLSGSSGDDAGDRPAGGGGDRQTRRAVQQEDYRQGDRDLRRPSLFAGRPRAWPAAGVSDPHCPGDRPENGTPSGRDLAGRTKRQPGLARPLQRGRPRGVSPPDRLKRGYLMQTPVMWPAPSPPPRNPIFFNRKGIRSGWRLLVWLGLSLGGLFLMALVMFGL